MNAKKRKTVVALSIVLVALFILAQFAWRTTGSAGGWCFPYLGAPQELGHPAFQFVTTGFPLPFVTVTAELCAETGATTSAWSPLGLGVDGLLLVLLATPLWWGLLKEA